MCSSRTCLVLEVVFNKIPTLPIFKINSPANKSQAFFIKKFKKLLVNKKDDTNKPTTFAGWRD